MAVDVFSDEWAAQWKALINQSQAFREAGRGWKGSLVMVLEREEGGRAAAVYADLGGGRCLQARAAQEDDLEEADFVIGASGETWKGLLEGSLDPMFAVLQGRLHLRQGKTAELLPHAQAAKAMVSAAKGIDADYEI